MENLFGVRLKQARLATGLSLRALAEKIGVSPTAIQKYEKGKVIPSSDMLIKLANALEIAVEYLFRPQNITLGELKFRKKASLGVKSFKTIEYSIRDQLERRFELENFYPNPPIKPLKSNQIPLFPIKSLDDVEELAIKLREHWNLGLAPIHDLADIMENQGIRVVFVETDEKDFDGLFVFVNKEPVVIINKNWPGDRQRFNLAHELGHFIFKDILSKEIDEEKACNRFAGAFIFPGPSVIQKFGKNRSAVEWQEILLAKFEYGLSMGAICFRLKDVGIVNDVYSRFLWTELSRKGWRKKEPGLELPSEKTHVFEQMLFHALGEEYISESKAAELLGYSLDQLRELRMIDVQKNSSR
jgi:Zn-dependent peptidase ImmA (M78 family)/DNA-binding XRE family transcriptional regulator